MKKELIAHKDPKSPISEVFRTLRANIQFMNTRKRSKVILITSTLPGEGKSWISSNLAVTFAQAGKTVLLIDADLRKGRQYNIFGVSPTPGLSNYLSGIGLESKSQKEINNEENYIQETGIENLYIMPAGDIPPNPSELLISPKMGQLFSNLREKCDIIIVDGTPCELVTDSLLLIRSVDTTVIVTAYKQTKRDSLKKVIESIKDVGGSNIGLVFNKIPISAKKYEESYYYGSTSMRKGKANEESKYSTTISKEKEAKIQKQIEEIKEKNINKNNSSSAKNTKKAKSTKGTKKSSTSKKQTTKKTKTTTGKSSENKKTSKKREVSKDKKDAILKQVDEFMEQQETDNKQSKE